MTPSKNNTSKKVISVLKKVLFIKKNKEQSQKKSVECSQRRCSVKKGVLRSFTKFIEKHLCQSLFFNKVAGIKNKNIFLDRTPLSNCFCKKTYSKNKFR